MDIYSMLYQRLTNAQSLSLLVAQYDNRPAVFYQRPATADDPKWGEVQYPRIDYNVDMQENPTRNTNGTLTLDIWCDTQVGAEPEDIEPLIRSLLHASFAQTDEGPYCFSWVRSDSFQVKTEAEQTVRTIGVTVVFDIVAFTDQATTFPDPIAALNLWTRSILPDATIIGLDEIEGWVTPTRTRPIVYWHITSQVTDRKHFTHTWLKITVEGYVFAQSAKDRLFNLSKIVTAQALSSHVPLEDGSPLFLRDFSVKPHFNYIMQGQIKATGSYGILQPQEHLRSGYQGDKLNHANYS